MLNILQLQKGRGRKPRKKGQEPEIQGIVGGRRFGPPCLPPHLFVSVKVPHRLWAPNTYQLQYTNTHVEQNLKANAMSFLTSKIRDDERQNLFNVKYIAVTWQIFCCFFVTRRFYKKDIYLGLISMYGGI